ncbi:hypothetical protein MKX03_000884 [Papaver bracteatum]|nr:hypothetical protein MKX03_000884 [Papaver bracteatum]
MANVRESSEGTKDNDAVKLKNFRKRMKRCRRRCPAQIDAMVRHSDNPEMYREEVRRYEQAKLGRVVNYATARRLEQGQLFYKEYYPEWAVYIPKEENKKSPTLPFSYKEDLQLETQNSEITKLTDVALRYSVEEQEKMTNSGTLEAHVNGFRYTISSPPVQIDFIYKNVKHAFFRSKDERLPPLLHFNLHVPINVEGTLQANDIQFQMVETVVGQKKSADDLDKIGKYKEYNEDFQKFVKKVEAKWNSHILPFELPRKKNEFHGSSGVFALTTFCLAGIVKTPFFVVALTEIEFVNFAHLRLGEIDTTIVLKDFTRNVFQIKSISSTSVTAIKEWFGILSVKYYENEKEHNWNDILEGIRRNPQGFIEEGCWRSVDLESSAAAALSSDSYESEESEFGEDKEEFQWEKLFDKCGSDSAEEESEA